MEEINMPKEMIGGFLIRIGAITTQQRDEILEKQKNEFPHKRFGELAIELGYINKEMIDKYFVSN